MMGIAATCKFSIVNSCISRRGRTWGYHNDSGQKLTPGRESTKPPALFGVPGGFRKVPKLPARTIWRSGGFPDGSQTSRTHLKVFRAGSRKVPKLPARTIWCSGGFPDGSQTSRTHYLVFRGGFRTVPKLPARTIWCSGGFPSYFDCVRYFFIVPGAPPADPRPPPHMGSCFYPGAQAAENGRKPHSPARGGILLHRHWNFIPKHLRNIAKLRAAT
jgi:hypothetical protein